MSFFMAQCFLGLDESDTGTYLGQSEGISEEDREIISFQATVTYTGSGYDEALTVFPLPGNRRAIMMTFEDRDNWSRGAPFSHTVILSGEDYRSIEGNPFLLVRSGLFRKTKRPPSHLQQLRWATEEVAVSDSPQEMWHWSETGITCQSLLASALSGVRTRVLVAGRRDELAEATLLAMPLDQRLDFSFSTYDFVHDIHTLNSYYTRDPETFPKRFCEVSWRLVPIDPEEPHPETKYLCRGMVVLDLSGREPVIHGRDTLENPYATLATNLITQKPGHPFDLVRFANERLPAVPPETVARAFLLYHNLAEAADVDAFLETSHALRSVLGKDYCKLADTAITICSRWMQNAPEEDMLLVAEELCTVAASASAQAQTEAFSILNHQAKNWAAKPRVPIDELGKLMLAPGCWCASEGKRAFLQILPIRMQVLNQESGLWGDHEKEALWWLRTSHMYLVKADWPASLLYIWFHQAPNILVKGHKILAQLYLPERLNLLSERKDIQGQCTEEMVYWITDFTAEISADPQLFNMVMRWAMSFADLPDPVWRVCAKILLKPRFHFLSGNVELWDGHGSEIHWWLKHFIDEIAWMADLVELAEVWVEHNPSLIINSGVDWPHTIRMHKDHLGLTAAAALSRRVLVAYITPASKADWIRYKNDYLQVLELYADYCKDQATYPDNLIIFVLEAHQEFERYPRMRNSIISLLIQSMGKTRGSPETAGKDLALLINRSATHARGLLTDEILKAVDNACVKRTGDRIALHGVLCRELSMTHPELVAKVAVNALNSCITENEQAWASFLEACPDTCVEIVLRQAAHKARENFNIYQFWVEQWMKRGGMQANYAIQLLEFMGGHQDGIIQSHAEDILKLCRHLEGLLDEDQFTRFTKLKTDILRIPQRFEDWLIHKRTWVFSPRLKWTRLAVGLFSLGLIWIGLTIRQTPVTGGYELQLVKGDEFLKALNNRNFKPVYGNFELATSSTKIFSPIFIQINTMAKTTTITIPQREALERQMHELLKVPDISEFIRTSERLRTTNRTLSVLKSIGAVVPREVPSGFFDKVIGWCSATGEWCVSATGFGRQTGDSSVEAYPQRLMFLPDDGKKEALKITSGIPEPYHQMIAMLRFMDNFPGAFEQPSANWLNEKPWLQEEILKKRHSFFVLLAGLLMPYICIKLILRRRARWRSAYDQDRKATTVFR